MNEFQMEMDKRVQATREKIKPRVQALDMYDRASFLLAYGVDGIFNAAISLLERDDVDDYKRVVSFIKASYDTFELNILNETILSEASKYVNEHKYNLLFFVLTDGKSVEPNVGDDLDTVLMAARLIGLHKVKSIVERRYKYTGGWYRE